MAQKSYKIYVSLAGHAMELHCHDPWLRALFGEYTTHLPPEFSVAVTEDDIRAEGGDYPQPTLESLAIYRKICERLLPRDVLLFHASALMMDGKAVLFAAPSGTGKSTQARLWRERFGDAVTMINDDKPLLRIGEEIRVYGTPYAGKEGLYTNISAPAAAIVLLHQAEGNAIRRVTGREAYPWLLNQAYRPKEAEGLRRTLLLVEGLARLPIYELSCTISQEAVSLVYNTLKGEKLL